METILFREKFADWPDQAKVSRVVEREIKIAKAIENKQAAQAAAAGQQ